MQDAGNNPVMNVDPSGLNATTAFGGLIYESWNFTTGNGFDWQGVKGALFDGYNGQGSSNSSLINNTWAGLEDALNFGTFGAGALIKSSVQLSIKQAERVAYTGIKEASEYLISQGVDRTVRKEVLQSFEVGTIRLQTADSATFGLRYSGGNAVDRGRYLFETFPASRESLALKPNWNQMTNLSQWQIPQGTIYIEGRAASQGVGYSGGQIQRYVLDPNKLKRK